MSEDSGFNFENMFMREAIKLAQQAYEADEVPVGAVITFGNKIIAKARNEVETLKDPTAHAEMIAITQAANTLSNKWLYDCDLYVTLEPCSMCAGALVLARVKRIIYGAKDPKTGGCGSVFEIAGSSQLNHKIEVVQGPFAEECSALVSDFFREKRLKHE